MSNAQVEARPAARRTEQIVISEELWVREALDAVKDEFGRSRSEVAGEAIRLGLPLVRARLERERAGVLAAASPTTETEAATGR